MKKILACTAAAVLLAVPARAADTWKGTISDSKCGAKHTADKHDGKGADHRECVEVCIKGGGKYAFLSGDKIYQIANQDFADLKVHAGHQVMLTGEMKDQTVTVTKIEMPKAEKK